MKNIAACLMAVLACGVFGSGVVHAQAQRTWVSGTGDDADPCSRTSPCKTFAGALSKTAAGGEISVLNSAGYGAVTIAKSITINGGGALAGITSSGTNAIRVQAGANDVVVLRNLAITTVGAAVNGISYVSGRALVIERSSIGGTRAANGIDVALTALGSLTVTDTEISGGNHGVRLNSTVRLDADLRNVKITNSNIGVNVIAGNVTIHDSLIANNGGTGVVAQSGRVVIEGTRIDGNLAAVQVVGGLARIANSSFYNNQNGLLCPGGPITSAYDNSKGGNVGGGLTPCPEPLPPLVIL